MIKSLIIILLSFAALTNAYAQPSSQDKAKSMTDLMQKEVGLDSKQYKTVYNLFVKDFKFIQKVSQGGIPPMGGNPSQMRLDGSNGQVSGSINLGQGTSLNGSIGAGSGGVGLRGGLTIGGSMSTGGMGGPTGGMGSGGSPSMPMGGMGEPNFAKPPIPDKYLEKEDTKLRKILSAEQYKTWRDKHPNDYLTYLCPAAPL